ncbi:MAG: ATP-binding protein [Gemmatimonadales bacterium]
MNDESGRAMPEPDLRVCVRDLVALSAMSASWIGRSTAAIAESVRDLLLDVLRADAAYVRVLDPDSDRFLAAAVGITEKEADDVSSSRMLLSSCPLGLGGELGRLVAGSARPDFPTVMESLLLQVTATQLTIALRHAALLTRHEQIEQLLGARAARQAAAARLGVTVIEGTRIDDVLDQVVNVICDTLHADYCEVLEPSPGGASLLLRAGVGWRPEAVGQAEVSAGTESQAGYTFSSGQAVVVNDLARDSRFSEASLLREHDVVSGVTVIIRDQTTRYGVLAAHSREPRVFTPDDLTFLQSVANLVAGALQREHSEAEREKLLHRAQRAAAARDRAVGIVSHDLRNPLSTIQICASALLDTEAPGVEGIRHMARIIQQSTAWMQQIVQDLLDRTSLDAGRLSLHREPTDVADVLGVAQGMFAPVAREQNLELVVETTTDLPLVDADPSRLLQVLSNLLSNAVKFTPAGGRVVLSARVAGIEPAGSLGPAALDGGVRFAVSDTGPGMAPDDLAHVFDWFWQSPRGGRSGAGLGLAIAKGLIEAHRGSLEVESAPGRGSTFWFTVPAIAVSASPSTVAPPGSN